MATVRGALLALLLPLGLLLADILQCEPGQGYPHDRPGCQLCRPGRWSDGTNRTCTDCAPGKWSSLLGADRESVCTDCPLGTWSSDPGQVWQIDCQFCPAGTFGVKTGASTETDCASCALGTFGTEEGATSAAACLRCPSGRFGGVATAPTEGSCTACPRGRWSVAVGASSVATCAGCPAGTFQPEPGMSSNASCQPCSPGTHSSNAGSTRCRPCPRGSFANFSGLARCQVCDAGRWTPSAGATSDAACDNCTGSSYCLAGATVYVRLHFRGLNYTNCSVDEEEGLSKEYVDLLADACEVDRDAVVDLYGANASVTLTEKGTVEAFVIVPEGSSANAFAEKIDSPDFEAKVRNATEKVWQPVPELTNVKVQPRTFTPFAPDTKPHWTRRSTRTVTTTTTTFNASRSNATALTVKHRRHAHSWGWISGVFFAILLLVLCLDPRDGIRTACSKRKEVSDEESLLSGSGSEASS